MKPKSIHSGSIAKRRLLLALFFLAGLSGLVCGQVYVRQIALVVGGAGYATPTAVAAIIAGLGIGAWAGGAWSGRLRRPGAVFGALTIGFGLYAAAMPYLLDLARPVYASLYQTFTPDFFPLLLCRFALSFVVLLAPAGAIGATLPLIVRQIQRAGTNPGPTAGYANATCAAGAFTGALCGGFLLLPAFGNLGALWIAAGLSVGAGIVAVALFAKEPLAKTKKDGPSSRKAKSKTPQPIETLSRSIGGTAVCGYSLLGLAAMALFIGWTRAGIMALDASAFSYATILAVFIGGVGIGNALGARLMARIERPMHVLGLIFVSIALVGLAGIPWFDSLPNAVSALYRTFGVDRFVAVSIGKFALIAGLILAPTILIGAVYPLTVRIVRASFGMTEAKAAGRVCAVNSLFAMIGIMVTGLALILPEFRIQSALAIACGLVGFVGVAYVWIGRRRGGNERIVATTMAIALAFGLYAVGGDRGRWSIGKMLAGNYQSLSRNPYQNVILHYEGADATVSVVSAPNGMTSVHVDGRPDSSTWWADRLTRVMMGHYAALLAPPDADKALLLGLDNGVTLNALASHKNLETIDAIEGLPGMVAAAYSFRPFAGVALDDAKRTRLTIGDSRAYLALSVRNNKYDIIVGEMASPWISGSGALFTREFYALCRDRLRSGGVAAFWLPGFSMRLEDFRTAVASILDVFPYVAVFEGDFNHYIFVCSEEPLRLDLRRCLDAMTDPRINANLKQIGYDGNVAWVLAGYIGNAEALRPVVGNAIATDGFSTFEFNAARNLFSLYEHRILAFAGSAESSIFHTLVTTEDELLGHVKNFAKQIEPFRQARQSRMLFMKAVTREEVDNAVTYARRAYELTPKDARLYVLLNRKCSAMAGRLRLKGRVADAETIEALIDEFDRPPALGGPLPDRADIAAAAAKRLTQTGVEAMNNRKFDVAEKAFRAALSHKEDFAIARVELARIELARDRASEALALLEPYRDNANINSNVSMTIAMTLTALERYDEAFEELEKSLSLGFRDAKILATSLFLKDLREKTEFRRLMDKYNLDLGVAKTNDNDAITSPTAKP